MKKNKITDEQQIKRLKEISLSNVYTCSGDIYKLLDSDNLQNLVRDIPRGDIKLSNKLVYGRNIITKEEKFIENLDKYVCFVKDFCYIDMVEQKIIIETTLNNKYTEILYSLKDYHEEEIYNEYITEFMKMLWFNLYDNIVFFSKNKNNYSAINIFWDDIKKYDFNKDISDLDKIFTQIINNRKNNLYNSFLHYSEYTERDYDFYANQINWVLEDYYKNRIVDTFNIRNVDHKMYANKTYLLFNIDGNFKKAKAADDIIVSFGMKNNHFNAMVSDELFRKNELLKLLDDLKLVVKSKPINEEVDFINPVLVFNFVFADGYQWLDIKFKHNYPNSDDYYLLELDKEEIIELYEIINNQIN